MNLASGLAQREREGPLWSLPHRLGAKTTFVVPPPPGPSRQRSRSASSSSDSSYEDESSSQPTTASSASDPAPLQPQQSDSVTDPPGNSAAAEGSLWRLHKPTSSTQLFRANSSFVSRYPAPHPRCDALRVLLTALSLSLGSWLHQASPGQAPGRAPGLR
jgi:hypothetical protein